MCNGESLHEQVRMVTPVCIEGLCSTQQLAIVLEEVVVACVGEDVWTSSQEGEIQG